MIKFSLKDIISHTKKYGFIYPSSDIYNGLSSVYDYGPNGVELKKNLKDLWWKSMVYFNNNIIGLDSSILMNSSVWIASGHVSNFSDIMVDNKDSNKRYRIDALVNFYSLFLLKNGNIENYYYFLNIFNFFLKKKNLKEIYNFLIIESVLCPISKTSNWTEVRDCNLMLKTSLNFFNNKSNIYLRPETAQGIFINFLNILKTSKINLPFGIAQIGKVFRNEIIARQFIFRMKEFEQMEMQFFINPKDESFWFNYWKFVRIKWYSILNIFNNNIKFYNHVNLSHYANYAVDIKYNFPFGFKEVEGIHSRTDFDIKNHQFFSKKKIQYFDSIEKKSYIPYVIETSVGCDRLFLMILCNSLIKEKKKDKERVYLNLPFIIAPVKLAILPLFKKSSLIEKSINIFNYLKYYFKVVYDDSQSIGKRYIKQDLIGTPYCITVDYKTLNNNIITIRDRNTMIQSCLYIDELYFYLNNKFNLKLIFDKLFNILN